MRRTVLLAALAVLPAVQAFLAPASLSFRSPAAAVVRSRSAADQPASCPLARLPLPWPDSRVRPTRTQQRNSNELVTPHQASGRPALRGISAVKGLRMSDKTQDERTFDGEYADQGRRQLEDLEGQWKRICVLGDSSSGSGGVRVREHRTQGGHITELRR